MDNELQQILNLLNIEQIPENRNYWLIRTGSGKFFLDFLANNYVAIGWDQFNNKEEFLTTEEKKLKEQIAKKYPEEKRPGYTYNQIKRFMFDIKLGDMVLIPSENSSQIAFGIVTKNFFVRNIEDSQKNPQFPECQFKKSIKVEWKFKISKNQFDPYLKMLMLTHTTISNVNDYKDYIDRILYPMYITKDKLHIIFNVKSQNNIPLLELSSFFSSICNYTQNFAQYANINISSDDLNVKVSVQSPGPIDIFGQLYNGISNNWGSILILALLLHYLVGGNLKYKKTSEEQTFETGTDGLLEKILKFKKENNEQKNTETKLQLEKENQNFTQYMEVLEIENPATVNTPGKLSDDENKTSEDTSHM